MGDVSARSALAVHRCAARRSPIARPLLVLGVDAPGAGHAALHDLMVTCAYFEALPDETREHLACRVVDALVRSRKSMRSNGSAVRRDERACQAVGSYAFANRVIGITPRASNR
jgi:hypothetical protein